MKVLVACEYSGRVRQAFRDKGHEAWSCDLLPSEDNSEYHIQGWVDDLLKEPWDLVIAHPPCTYLSNSGVRWLYPQREGDMIENLRAQERWENMRNAALFFVECLQANSDRVAVENPVMHGHGKKIIEECYNEDVFGKTSWFSVQPWQFGDNYKKRTCFTTRGLEPLKPTSNLNGSTAEPAVWKMGPSENRWKERSRTYEGVAKAMAEQWG